MNGGVKDDAQVPAVGDCRAEPAEEDLVVRPGPGDDVHAGACRGDEPRTCDRCRTGGGLSPRIESKAPCVLSRISTSVIQLETTHSESPGKTNSESSAVVRMESARSPIRAPVRTVRDKLTHCSASRSSVRTLNSAP